ncbi:MAG TPA: transposase [Geminicoccaceae bacterium]|nr:transposase [Geminicoccaceae bacterium]
MLRRPASIRTSRSRTGRRGLDDGRAPAWSEAGPPSGSGACRRATDRARLGHHRYEWLDGTAFVQPTRGETVWYLPNGSDPPFFERLLAACARQTGAGRERVIVPVLDNAGWHTEPGLAVPDGIRLVRLPPYSPELQPAEHLWPRVDEPIVNRHFATLADLDAVLARRCRRLRQDHALIAAHTLFHWWPKPISRNRSAGFRIGCPPAGPTRRG